MWNLVFDIREIKHDWPTNQKSLKKHHMYNPFPLSYSTPPETMAKSRG
jgi:hypothetical protein